MDPVELLRRYCVDDRRLPTDGGTLWPGALDERTAALVRIGALIAMRGPAASFHSAIDDGVAAGASIDEIVAVVDCAVDIVGLPRAVAAAPRIADALGYDEDLLADTGP